MPSTNALRAFAALVAALLLSAVLAAQGASISREAFASLRWLEGRWVGAGGGYAAFYEEYVFLNDSTIEQREFGSDSTFARASGRSTIEWRGGRVLKRRGAAAQSALASVRGDTARFESTVAGRGGFTWMRRGPDAWQAVLDRPGEPIVYELRRVGRRAGSGTGLDEGEDAAP